ncbi:MAG: hypothetical protein E7253_01545 [Lachnospiraceae bacterium]|nr:hypothetical protein [Lachnospiraceae bacterium]
MKYLMTYQGKTEPYVPDFEGAVLLGILSSWHETEVTIPSYIYEHRKEYVEDILFELKEGERRMLNYYYVEGQTSEDTDGDIITRFHLDQDAFLENVYDILYQIQTAGNVSYLETGFPYKRRLSMGDSWLTNWVHKAALKRELVEEICSYIRGDEAGLSYLPGILKKRPVDRTVWLQCSRAAAQGLASETLSCSTGIEVLDWSVRAYNCLRRAGIANVGELLGLTGEDLFMMSGVSKKVLKEIEDMQDEIRAGWFLNQDKNLFELDFPFEGMEILLEQGYFFLEDMKKDSGKIESILEKEGLKEISHRFHRFIKAAKRVEWMEGEKITFTFPYRDLYEREKKEYHIKLDGDLDDCFLEDMILYPYKDRCLAAAKSKAFEKMIEDMSKNQSEQVKRAMRFLVSFSDLVSAGHGFLTIRAHQMKYIWPYPDKEPEHFVIKAVEGKPPVDYIIQPCSGEEEFPIWEEEECRSMNETVRWSRECAYKVSIYPEFSYMEEEWEETDEEEQAASQEKKE